MVKWLSAKNSESFGIELATLVKEFIPNDHKLSDRKRQSIVDCAKERVLKRMRQFRQQEILNFYKTAKLPDTFKWDMKDAGYDPRQTDSLATWVLITLRAHYSMVCHV